MNLYKVCSIALSLFFYFNSSQSFAQSTRTWVSGTGDDANPCSRTAPCKTFAGAITNTASGGEIDCLDPGGFGAVTITKSLTIYCKNTDGGVLAGSGTTGIIINASPTDKVVLDGLNIEGLGAGHSGVRILSAASVTIANASIRNFTTSGINVASSALANVTVINSIITGNTTGVSVDGTNGATLGLVNSIITGNTNPTSTSNGGKIVSYAAGNVIKN